MIIIIIKSSSALKKKEYHQLKEDIYNVYSIFYNHVIKEEYNTSDKFINIITFAYNIEEIFKEHYFSVNFEQIKTIR